MKLRLFRSLVGSRRVPRVSHSLPSGTQQYDGLEVSLAQLEVSPALLDECAEHSMRLVCRCEPTVDVHAAEAQLGRLSSHLGSRSAEAAAALELVVLEATPRGLDEALCHMHDIQPFWSEFLEAHTSVGSRHGKLNAHGKPLNHHVLGVCHRLQFEDAADIAEIIEILTPTRVALTSSNLAASLLWEPSLAAAAAGASLPAAFDGLSDELDSIIETSDLLYADAAEASAEHAPLHALWDEVWSAQQLAGAAEVYAACVASGDDDAADAAAHGLGRALRQRFDESAQWRARAADRRAARDAAAAARRRAAPSSTIGSAAKSFGLLPADVEQGFDKAFLKERWRELALRAHPDVAGGSGERFQELRAAYQVLLRAAH
jgi:hypothetical protein